jgi:phenylacetate-CoA ligase
MGRATVFGSVDLDAEAVYLRLPIFFQNAACTLVGWRTERTRYAGDFPRILAEANARTYWGEDKLEAFRDARLAATVRRSASLPFYRERFREAGLDPKDVQTMNDLTALPILTKEEARDSLVAQFPRPTGKTRMTHTSGTTGGALRFPLTLTAVQEQWATWWRYRWWHGIERGTWCGLFAGRSVVPTAQQAPPFWRVNHAGRQLLFSGYHMSPPNLPAYVAELRRRRLPWLHGYPSLLALLATHLSDSGSDLGYQLRWVTTGAENLLPHQASVIERALGVRPIQHYGLAEGVANISQCEGGRFHVDEDYAPVEFVPVGRDDLYRIVGTNVTNPVAPLLRYDTQDLATLADGASCECGRAGRVVERVDGRLEDYVVLADGTQIGRMDHIFKDMVNIREAQIHQKFPGALTIRVVRNPQYTSEDERLLRRETAKRVGTHTRVDVDYVDTIARSSTGKLRLVVSELPGSAVDSGPT